MPKFTINIDFDEASRQWRIHTQADNPAALRKKQRAYWREVRKATGPTRRSKRTTAPTTHRMAKRKRGPVVTNITTTRNRRSCGAPSRLINEC